MARLPQPGERYWPSLKACADDPSVPFGRTALHAHMNSGALEVLRIGGRNVVTETALQALVERLGRDRDDPRARRERFMRRRNWRLYRRSEEPSTGQ